jgi:hypothetical protein
LDQAGAKQYERRNGLDRLTPREQLQKFKTLLQERSWGRNDKIFAAALDFLRVRAQNLDITDEDRAGLRVVFKTAFEMNEEDLRRELSNAGNGKSTSAEVAVAEVLDQERNLEGILPRAGFLRRYVDYTSHSEAPLAYHTFSALCALGSVLNRRVWLDMGYYRVFPVLGIIILGPSGIKKTSATNIAVDLLHSLGTVKIYSEKLTPEALIDAMKGDATGLLYAPEMTVFLNKVRYNEGMIQLITRFMDCPDFWESGTIMRGKHALRNIAISSLMCSTSDWFIRSTPEDSFGGGFIARNLLIVQESSTRCEPIPRPGDPSERDRLVYELAFIRNLEGEIEFSQAALRRYDDWYRGDHQLESKAPEHELLATYYQRKSDHIKRIAICFHLAEHADLRLCLDCFNRALLLLNWTEQFIPGLLEQMFRSSVGAEQDQVLRTIKSVGVIDHTDLIRRLSYRMNAQQVRAICGSLKEAKLIEEFNDPLLGHGYRALK